MDEAEHAEIVAQAKAALERLRAALGEAADPLPAAREAVRKRPLTALALAFGVGLALAALTRG